MSPVLTTAFGTANTVKDSAHHTRENVLELGVQALKFLNTMRSTQVRVFDSALEEVGLQRREGPLRPVVYFFAGAAIVGCTVLVLAPTSGKKVRAKLADVFRASRRNDDANPDRGSPRTEDDVASSTSSAVPEKAPNGSGTHAAS